MRIRVVEWMLGHRFFWTRSFKCTAILSKYTEEEEMFLFMMLSLFSQKGFKWNAPYQIQPQTRLYRLGSISLVAEYTCTAGDIVS